MRSTHKRLRASLYPGLALATLLATFITLRQGDPGGTPEAPETTASRDSTRSFPAPITSGPQSTASLDAFRTWQASWSSATPGEKASLMETGLRIARERRPAMEALIRTNPQEALSQAIPLDAWSALPAAIRAEVEEPFSVTTGYQVMPVCHTGATGSVKKDSHPDAIRMVDLPDAAGTAAFVYGRREGLGSKTNAPLQGIRLGKASALREEVFQTLSGNEIAAAESTYPLANRDATRDYATGETLGDQPVVALSGGRIFKFASEESLGHFSTEIAKLDEAPGPGTGAGLIALPSPLEGGETGFDLPAAIVRNNNAASAWTETKKKVFIIRCDFSDRPDSTYPTPNPSTYATILNTTVSDAIRDYSYGKTWIESTVSGDVTRLPQTAAYYATDDGNNTGSTRNGTLRSDARNTYFANHSSFVPGNYDIIGVWFTGIGMTSGGVNYAGLANLGVDGLWIQGTTDAGVHVHEFGHNYDLGHSSSWEPPVGSTDPIGTPGTSTEYGDIFDVMGDGPVAEGHFHSQAKQRLNWLAAGEWTDATAGGNGTYRLYRIDDDATTGVRGLRVTRASDEYFWLSYRRLFNNNWLKAGANIVWKRPGQTRSWLIDTTPSSQAGTADKNDGSIAIGRTFTSGNVNITPLARGGSGAQEYLDIRVNTGPFAGNSAPVVTLNGPTTISARQTVIFTAQATDANGDELAYSWDFGQGFAFDNHPEAAFAWTTGGTFTVKVTVSDMKGGSTQATKIVTVTDSINAWNTRTHSATNELYALAASPTKVLAIGHQAVTSPDGVTWTTSDVDTNQYSYGATWDGSQFIAVGEDYSFSPPVGWQGAIHTSATATAGSWTRRYLSGSRLLAVAHGNGIYIAVGEDGTIVRSTNGTSWSPVASGTTNRLTSVAYGGGKFVITGFFYEDATESYNGNACVLTSSDGLSWTNTTSGSGLESWQDFRQIAWAKDRFLASGWYSKLRHSVDLGNTFQTNLSTNDNISGFAHGNGVWFAAGLRYVGSSSTDIDMVSSDGVNWTDLTTPSLDNRKAAIFFNNSFITIGANRVIRQSGTIGGSAAGYPLWRDSYFPDHGPGTNPGGDADTDGMVNLLEYSLGISPASGSGGNGAAALPQAVSTNAEPTLSDRIALQVSLPEPAPGDMIYSVEIATTLPGAWTTLATKTGAGGWVWTGGGTSRIVTGTPSGGRVTVKVGDSTAISADAERFMRLRVRVNQ